MSSLAEILAARDARRSRQLELLAEYPGKALVVLTVVLPDSVTTIGARAFEGCSRLVSVTVGAGLADIGGYAFRNCDRLF